MTYPKSVPEWKTYISGLHGSELRSKAMAANTLSFVRQLQVEGVTGGEIAAIFVLFAEQFISDEQMPPVGMYGQYLSYADLLDHLKSKRNS